MNTPHDTLFKILFSDLPAAVAELRAVLPAPIAAAADWSTLERLPESHVEPAFAEEHSDLVFAIRLAGREARLHLILEHKSTSDRWTAFQVAWYSMRLLRRFRRDHPRAERLPPVIAVVIRHGARQWSATTELADLFDVDDALRDALAPWLPHQRFLLDDLSCASEAELRGRSLSAAHLLGVLMLQRLGHAADPAAEFFRLGAALRDAHRATDGAGLFVDLLTYVIRVLNLDAAQTRDLALEVLGPEKEPAMTSVYDQLISQGRAEGRATSLAETLIRLLETRFGPVTESTKTQIRSTAPETLEEWTLRVLSAETVEDVLRAAPEPPSERG